MPLTYKLNSTDVNAAIFLWLDKPVEEVIFDLAHLGKKISVSIKTKHDKTKSEKKWKTYLFNASLWKNIKAIDYIHSFKLPTK